VVIKDEARSPLYWNCRLLWKLQEDGTADKSTPLEAELQRRLTVKSAPSKTNILPYRGHRVDQRKRVCRLYTQFARLGDGKHLIKQAIKAPRQKYRAANEALEEQRKKTRNAKKIKAGDERPSGIVKPVVIPERFIWRVFEALVKAAISMESGTRDYSESGRKDGGDSNWVRIVHRDIKPANIVFGLGAAQQLEGKWPIPLLNDFGSAVELRSEWDNPADFAAREFATYLYRAPEQQPCLGEATTQLGWQTNVYGIGVTIYALMNGRAAGFPSGKEMKQKDKGEEEKEEEEGAALHELHENGPENMMSVEWNLLDELGNGKYSRRLRKTVLDCLAYNPDERRGQQPDFVQGELDAGALWENLEDLLRWIRICRKTYDRPNEETQQNGSGGWGYFENAESWEMFDINRNTQDIRPSKTRIWKKADFDVAVAPPERDEGLDKEPQKRGGRHGKANRRPPKKKER
jgi:serine/threonine protein kinase